MYNVWNMHWLELQMDWLHRFNCHAWNMLDWNSYACNMLVHWNRMCTSCISWTTMHRLYTYIAVQCTKSSCWCKLCGCHTAHFGCQHKQISSCLTWYSPISCQCKLFQITQQLDTVEKWLLVCMCTDRSIPCTLVWNLGAGIKGQRNSTTEVQTSEVQTSEVQTSEASIPCELWNPIKIQATTFSKSVHVTSWAQVWRTSPWVHQD